MKIWIVLFLLLLAAGAVVGISRDLFSRERAVLKGVVVDAETGEIHPKSLPSTPPRYKVRLADGQVVGVATTNARSVPVGGAIIVTEWMTPWGHVWYTQRD